MGERRIAIVGGGTAGHVYPALTIAAAYQQVYDNIDLLFLGIPEGFEARLVPAYGYCLKIVQGSPWFGVGVRGKLCALKTLVIGMLQARRLLKAHGTRLVIGLGGYASMGVVFAAWSLGLQTAIHEANHIPGLSNRLLGRFVDRVYLGFETALWAFPAHRTLITGNPVRSQIARVHVEPKSPPCMAGRPVHILVTGGSYGAPFLNRRVPELLRQVAAHGLALEIQHQVGNDNPAAVREAYTRANLSASVTPYLDKMAEAYHWADFVICRAGAGTIAELAICGLPALLVPWSDAADGHQTANAAAVVAAGGGWWVDERDWQVEALASRLVALLSQPAAWLSMSEAARRLAIPDADKALVADCEAAMLGKW